MNNPPQRGPEDAPLNPALRSRTETVYDTTNTTPDPLETTGAKEGQGEGWPWIWAVVTVACVLITIYLLI